MLVFPKIFPKDSIALKKNVAHRIGTFRKTEWDINQGGCFLMG